jgi:hypothetical protein
MAVYRCARGDRRFGPFTAGQLKQLEASGQLRPDDLVKQEGGFDWTPANEVEGLFAVADPDEFVGDAPPPIRTVSTGHAPNRYATLILLAGIFKGVTIVVLVCAWALWVLGLAIILLGGVSRDVPAVAAGFAAMAIPLGIWSFLAYLVNFSIAELILLATDVANETRTSRMVLEKISDQLGARR